MSATNHRQGKKSMGRKEGIGSEFLLLCCITFLTLCNTAIFHNFLPYLLTLGFSVRQAGFIIGLYPLASMLMYGFLSGMMNRNRARGFMVLGLLITGCCQVSYHFAISFPALAIIRISSGIGLFLTMASSMNLLVNAIPPGKTGSAFSLYSVAMLLPYSVMPAFTEIVTPYIQDTTVLYILVSLVLLPAIGMVMFGLSGIRNNKESKENKERNTVATASGRSYAGSELRANLLRIPVLGILLLNGLYFFVFSSLFYLLRGYGISLGVENPGYFFTIQMGIMVVLRLVAGGVFDSYSKEMIAILAFFVTGIGYFVLAGATTITVFFASSVLFGLGMGLCIPPLNALMYLHAEQKFRGYNANMMLLAMHFGSFCGPFGGAVLTASGGFTFYCMGAGLLIVIAVCILILLKQRYPVVQSS